MLIFFETDNRAAWRRAYSTPAFEKAELDSGSPERTMSGEELLLRKTMGKMVELDGRALDSSLSGDRLELGEMRTKVRSV